MARTLILISTFLSAFLLFIIQPMYAKFLLPYFGGTPSVWTISVFFYSITLLLGYVYATLLAQWQSKVARTIHTSLLVMAGALLLSRWFGGESPILVDTVSNSSPALSVLLTLLLAIGLPVLLLASTSIIAQHLYARLTAEEPYKLYSLSNIGSFFGLAAYPFLLEPFTKLTLQSAWWSGLFIVFGILLAGVWRQVDKTRGDKPHKSAEIIDLKLNNRGIILLMAAIPTFLLVSTTEFLTKGIASFPLLWIIPLMLYLLSFIVSFRNLKVLTPNIPLGFWSLASLVPVFALIPVMNDSTSLYWIGFLSIVTSFFLLCTYFHRRIYKMRPRVKDLGTFYIWLTLGGALGSGTVGLLLPLVLNDQIEFFIVIGLLLIYLSKNYLNWIVPRVNEYMIGVTKGFSYTLAVLFILSVSIDTNSIEKERNFFGTVSVLDVTRTVDGEEIQTRFIVNGEITHGLQALDDRYKEEAASYYGPNSGIDIAMRSFSDLGNTPRVSVIGMGVGMMNAYCEDSESISYVEINPQVETIAREYFTYLDMCPSKTSVKIGDGRLILEQEVLSGNYKYDIIMMDAFTDDAIPSHLLTKQAFDNAYSPLLSEKGIIAFHVTNRYLNLSLPIVGVARDSGYEAVIVENIPDKSNELYLPTFWILVTGSDNIDSLLEFENVRQYSGKEIVWTDDKNSVLSVLSLGGSNSIK